MRDDLWPRELGDAEGEYAVGSIGGIDAAEGESLKSSYSSLKC
jgi:hypothetical protein